MKLRVATKDGTVDIDDVRAVLVSDQHGNPVIGARQQTPTSVWCVSADNKGFDDLMSSLGLGFKTKVDRVIVK